VVAQFEKANTSAGVYYAVDINNKLSTASVTWSVDNTLIGQVSPTSDGGCTLSISAASVVWEEIVIYYNVDDYEQAQFVVSITTFS
jgi:hypothetical protein